MSLGGGPLPLLSAEPPGPVQAGAGAETPSEIISLLEKYTAVFNEVPAWLLPKHVGVHGIDLTSGVEPPHLGWTPHRPVYRVATDDPDELRKQL